jgi:hypothetical protein
VRHFRFLFPLNFLGSFAFADIADDGGEEAMAADDDLGNRGFDGEFNAVGTEGHEGPLGAHRAGGDAGFGKNADMIAVNFVKTRGNEAVERLADCLIRGKLKHFLGSVVKKRDLLVFVDGDNGIPRGGDNPQQSLTGVHGSRFLSRSKANAFGPGAWH